MPLVERIPGQQLMTKWRSSAIGTPYVSAISNIKHVQTELHAYLVRIGGLILLIVLVVTIGTMLVLYRQLLHPLLRLRTSALAAGAAPREADQHQLSHTRNDELGNLIDAHNALLTHVSASMVREADAAREREHFISRHDVLTGLPNRVALVEYLRRIHDNVARNGQISFFLIAFQDATMTDRDLPQRARDALLTHTAPRDFVAQLGPLQFAVIKNHGRYDCAQFAESILEWDSQHSDDASIPRFDTHIGIVEAPVAAIDVDLLIQHAEFALNRARTSASLRYQFFDAEAASDALARHTLARDLKRALMHNELVVWYQPKINLQSADTLSGAEALVRWQHPIRGIVNPAEFIPVAEATGQIQEVDRTVLRLVCKQIAQWRTQYGDSPKVAVNLSASHFASPTLADELVAMVGDTGIFTTDLEIEITETTAMRNSDASAATLKKLRALGFRTAIDDFGTGYSSLAYLQRFEVDTLKIDRSFVDAIGHAAHGGEICTTILRLGHALGTRVVAEGVETADQTSFLRDLQCDEAQGYWFSKPLMADAFEEKWLGAARNSSAAPLKLTHKRN